MGRVRAVNRILTVALEETRRAARNVAGRSPRTLAIVAVCLTVVGVGPLVLTLFRADHYTSSSTITLQSADPSVEQSRQLRGIRELLGNVLISQPVQQQLRNLARYLTLPEDAPEHVEVHGRRQADKLEFVVSVQGPTAKDAQTYARAVSSTLLEAAEPYAQTLRAALLRRTRKALRRSDPGTEQHRALTRRRDLLGARVRGADPIFMPTPSGGTLEEERLADRLVGALPGRQPARPHPALAALAGIGLAAALALWVGLAGLWSGSGTPTGDRSAPVSRGAQP